MREVDIKCDTMINGKFSSCDLLTQVRCVSPARQNIIVNPVIFVMTVMIPNGNSKILTNYVEMLHLQKK